MTGTAPDNHPVPLPPLPKNLNKSGGVPPWRVQRKIEKKSKYSNQYILHNICMYSDYFLSEFW